MGRSLPRMVAAFVAMSMVLPMDGQVLVAAASVPAGGASPQAVGGQGSGEITTIRVRSNIVVIDVVVNDSKGNPIHGLKQEDFTLNENGKPQMIRRFEEHTALPAEDTSKVIAPPKLPPGLFTNKAPTPANGPVNVLLLDYLNTPLTAQPYARKQLLDYLNKAPAGTRIAIFALSTHLVMLQGFTSDPEKLKAALTAKKGAPQASNILSNPETGGPQGNTTLSDNFSSDALDAGQQLANIERSQALEASFEQDLRTKITLGAFDLLSRYLVGIPGRKNVVWFSGSFPMSVEPQVGLQDAFDSVVRNDEEIRKTDNMMTRAQIAVYPVDARGLFNDPANSAVNGASGGGPVRAGDGVVAGSQSGSSADAQMAFLQQTAQEHETMLAMAEDTGGKAFINTNDLTKAVAQAIENGSNYYTLTYTPTNTQWDGKFRAIKVKVEHPGAKLAYRNGYYADNPEDRNRNIAGSAATAMNRPTTMATAMLRGGPDPSEILFKVRIRPSATPPKDDVVAGNRTNPDPKVGVKGPYKEFGIDLVPDKSSINCPVGANGNRRCALEMATYVYDSAGQLIVAASARTAAVITPDTYAKMQVSGMAFHQQISVPVKGDYYLRTALHDLTSDRVGAVEVPVAAVAKLPPLQAAAVGSGPLQLKTTSTDTDATSGSAAPGTVPGTTPAAPATPGAGAGAPVVPAAPAAPVKTPQ